MSGPIVRAVHPRQLAVALALAVLALSAVSAQAASAPAPFPVVDGTIHSAVVAGNTLFIGGEFSTVTNPGAGTGITRRNLAAIEIDTGLLRDEWRADVTKGEGDQAVVYALAVSVTGGTLFVGGDFDTIGTIGDTSRDNLAAVSTAAGVPVTAWGQNPGPDAAVRALARSPDGFNLYLGGDFLSIGDDQRLRLASVRPGDGALLPWDPVIDGAVHALALDSERGRLFAGGAFALVDGVSCPGYAAISLSSARATACDPLFAGDAVHAIVNADDALVIGGSFTTIAGQTRNNLAVLDGSGAAFALDAWHPDIDAAVRALAVDTIAARLYAGGDFMTVQSGADARARLVAFRLEPHDDDDRLQAWDPGANDTIRALAIGAGGERLFAGGGFTEIGDDMIAGLAALPIATPVTVADPSGGGYRQLGFVTLECNDRSGAGCARICYTVTDGPPAESCSATPPDSVEVVIGSEVTTLRFYSEDADGNREAERTERYAIDDEAPVTEVSLPPLPDGWYGAATLEPIAMTCVDNHAEFGCATHYTLDGSEPTTESTRYTTPVSLASLLPPPSVPAGEVDPLQHLSGTFTLRVFSIDDAGNREDTQELVYRVDLAAPVVTASLPSGTFIAPATLNLECDDGAGSGCEAMYYTTDNRTPSDGTLRDTTGNLIPATARYEGPLTLTEATVLRVLAIDRAGNSSSRIIGVYALSDETRETRSGVGAIDWTLCLALLALLSIRTGRAR